MGKQALVHFFWAYCAKDSRLPGHVWEPTGGIIVSEVERFAKTRDTRRETAVP